MQKVFGLLGLGLVCFLTACNGDDDDDDGFVAPGGGTCAARSGAYTLHFAEKSGDCGPVDDQIVVAGGMQMQDPNCTGGPVDTDTCTITSQITCANGDGTETTLAGQIRWDQASTKASGTWQFTLTDSANNVLCQSTYGVTATR
jgi:hypothetical protein